MNIRKSTASAVVARGDSKGRTTLAMEFKALHLGLTHFYNEWLFTIRWRCCAPDFEISICRSFNVPEARSSALEVNAPPPSARILARRLLSYLGSASASCAT